MTLLELILTAVSLALDAFTISVCKGLKCKDNRLKDALIVSSFFGLFQTIMPIFGNIFGNIFTEKIVYYNPYISTILLITIGIIIYREDSSYDVDYKMKFWGIILLSIATSIDALIIGISFSFLKVSITLSCIIIGIITFVLCFLGFYLGNIINTKISKYSNRIAGIILICLGIKIFVQNLLK